MNEKQQQLTFDKGITNVPSDAICSDNTLEESVGMIYDEGEHRVIQKPVVFVDTETPIAPIMEGFHLLYVHKFNNEERYIGYTYDSGVGHNNNYLCYATKSGTTLTYRELDVKYTNETKVTSVGKTLVVSSPEYICYFIWKVTQVNGVETPDYENLGEIPDANFNFWLVNGIEAEQQADRMGRAEGSWKVYNTGSAEGMIVYSGVTGAFNLENKETFNDLVIGLYSRNKKSIKADKRFCCPFLVRTALELYDGTYTHISQPILLWPCETENSYALFQFWGGINDITIYTTYSELHFIQTEDLSGWSDIIKDIVVFVSDDIEVYNTLKDQPCDGLTTRGYTTQVDGVFRKSTTSSVSSESEYVSVNWFRYYTIDNYIEKSLRVLALRDKDSILNDTKSASVFYKVASVGLKPHNSDTNIAKFIEEHTLENLTTQESIKEDDYFSRSALYPNSTYSYNSRLNLANVARSMFEGYGFFMPFDNATTSVYDFYVRIKTDVEKVWVHHQESTKQKQGIYFYYPDSRADRVTIYKGGNCVCDQELTEHPGLNGAYYLKGLPGIDADEATVTVDSIEGFDPNRVPPAPDVNNRYDNSYLERLANYIITSEVNNPWVFKAEGYNKVGTGKIIGMSTLTQALSQGQFGQYPLLVFSESGIWAMSVNNTGLFQAIHPMSREVCNNAGSITQTDGAVFFTSEKGLMVVVGSDVKCVSEQLSGLERNFTGEVSMGNIRDYMKDCFIAYDYRDSLLWIFNNSRTHVVDGSTVPYNTDYCYVYAIKTGTFGKYQFSSAISNVVNNYPDYLLQSGSTLYSLTGRQNINLDTDTYTGLMITRPMKLENGLALKSLMQIRHIKDMQGTMTMRIYASNNLTSWTELHSLRGMPWKYYRFRYDFAGMKATDRFTGTMLITQERRTDKLR